MMASNPSVHNPETDFYAGYTAANDARDRVAACLPPNPHWEESAALHREITERHDSLSPTLS